MKYIDLEFELANGQSKHAYIPCKDLFDPYNGKEAIRIELDTSDHKNYIKLVINDPDDIKALVQSDAGLRIMTGTVDQHGVVKLSGETLAIAAADDKTAMTPADVLSFIKKSRAPGYQGFNEYNDTTLKAINELATTKILEDEDAKDPKDLATYKLVRTQIKNADGDLETVVKGATIHEHKVIWQVDAFADAIDPADYELYRLINYDDTSIEDHAYQPGLYMYKDGAWIKVGGGDAIIKVQELPEEKFEENVFYQIDRKSILLGRYDFTEEAKELGWHCMPEGIQREDDTIITWQYVSEHWASYWNSIIEPDPNPKGMIVAYRYTDEDPDVTHAEYDWHSKTGSIWYYYRGEWVEVWTKFSKRYIDADNFVLKTPAEEGMTWVVNEVGAWELGPAGGLEIVEELPDYEDAKLNIIYYLNTFCKYTLPDGSIKFYDVASYIKSEDENEPYIMVGHEAHNAYVSLDKLEDYLYVATYDELDYKNLKVFDDIVNVGDCTSVANTYGKLKFFDWKYDNSVQFVVKTHNAGRHDTIGVASGLSMFDKAMVEKGGYNPLWKIMPFSLSEGMNDTGLYASIHLIPREPEWTPTTGTHPEITDPSLQLPANTLVRYIIDHHEGVYDWLDLRDGYNIYVPEKIRDMGYEIAVMVSRDNHSAIYYTMNNSLYRVIDPIVPGTMTVDKNMVLTNFLPTGISGIFDDPHHVVATPLTRIEGTTMAPSDYGILNHAEGLERFNEAATTSLKNFSEVQYAINSLTYENIVRETEIDEFTHFEARWSDLGVDINNGTYADYENARAELIPLYENLDRDNPDDRVWVTTHISYYDLINAKLHVASFEHNWYEFDLPFSHKCFFDIGFNEVESFKEAVKSPYSYFNESDTTFVIWNQTTH